MLLAIDILLPNPNDGSPRFPSPKLTLVPKRRKTPLPQLPNLLLTTAVILAVANPRYRLALPARIVRNQPKRRLRRLDEVALMLVECQWEGVDHLTIEILILQP